MPRFCATAATPAVRQLASPTSTSSTGVAPRSSDANTSGWSASNENSVLCVCSLPSPWKPCTVLRLWVPFFHLQEARHVNFAACGAPWRASLAASDAPTFTPLLTPFSAIVSSLREVMRARSQKLRIIHRPQVRRPTPSPSTPKFQLPNSNSQLPNSNSQYPAQLPNSNSQLPTPTTTPNVQPPTPNCDLVPPA